MIAKRRALGTTSRNSSTRLPTRSGCRPDNPVTFPPGRARLATKSSGLRATAKTMGMDDVAWMTAGTAAPEVTMTSTFMRTNSVAISV
jgi:hypothetical protein